MTTQIHGVSGCAEMSPRWTRWIFSVSVIPALLISTASIYAQAPYPVESFASIDELGQEAKIQVERLEKVLASPESFEKQKEKSVVQAFGLLACVGQGLAEHAESAKSPYNGPALRDAAMKFNSELDHAGAKEALEGIKQVLDGKVTGDREKLRPWNELIEMYPAMEEMNTRNSEILKVLKRPRGNPEEISPVVAWGLLGLAMRANSDYASEDDEQAKWNGWSDEFHQATIKLGESIRAKEKETGRTWFDKASATCEACHKVFSSN